MVTITDAALRHTVYETVYDLVKTASSSYGCSATPSLVGGYPDSSTISYPIISLMPITAEESEFTIDTDHSQATKDIHVPFMLFAKVAKDLDYMSDGITNTLKNNTFSGAYLVNISEENGFVTPAQQKIKVKTLSFMYRRR